MPISEKRYLQLVLEDPEGKWELVDGYPRKKPAMTWEHNHTARRLAHLISLQLDLDEWEVIHDSGRVRRSEKNYFVPDVYVVPMEMVRRLFTRSGMTELYPEPLPLVVEVWSPSTGDYDVTEKLEEYQRRRDAEIWLIHPYERWIRMWRLHANDDYEAIMVRGGAVQPIALPGVTINFDTLFR